MSVHVHMDVQRRTRRSASLPRHTCGTAVQRRTRRRASLPRRAAHLPRQLRNKVVRVRRLQFAGRVELRDLIRRKRPSDRVKVILELLHASRPDDRRGYTWLLQEPVNGYLGRVPLQGLGNFVQTIQGMPRLLVIVGTPSFAPILLLREFDT